MVQEWGGGLHAKWRPGGGGGAMGRVRKGLWNQKKAGLDSGRLLSFA